MSLEVIFLVTKQRELEKNSTKRKLPVIFLKKKSKMVLTNRPKNVIKNIARYIKNISTHLKNYGKHLSKKQKSQYGLDHLFNEDDKKPVNKFKDARDLLNERRSHLSLKETKETRKKHHKKEVVDGLKEKEQNDSLTDEEKKVLKRINKYLKNFKNDLDKLQKYQYNITHGIDYLFNEEDDYYKPKEVKRAFDGGYILYESRGDNDARLSIDEYFNIIKPYLKDMIDDHKPKGEWKIQLSMRVIFSFFFYRCK